MPFTFSHPEIVLPLLKKIPNKFSFTGLVAGPIVLIFRFYSSFNLNDFGNLIVSGISAFILALTLMGVLNKLRTKSAD